MALLNRYLSRSVMCGTDPADRYRLNIACMIPFLIELRLISISVLVPPGILLKYLISFLRPSLLEFV